ncbi:hypothetical protein M947_08685 [Sulfurimonas hongkongensis]|uniref:Uncharacterized protein n=1 Tax=Sulfurimonas hongkongensis TaxID=1172190 RepID=T0JCQ0_9BACT|nr:DUF5718 family protein [Sulfurimonas hongkongensis]EQB38765.1 hypothetical protein M947_08685 [Sulfurimonas hongkongensis]
MAKYKKFLGLGIAGNFALHLEQAGEMEEFKDVITADEAAPKGMFPFYLPQPPNHDSGLALDAKNILSIYPLSTSHIKLPSLDANIQAEPEVGLICDLEYSAGKLTKITPTHFGAFNDCSIRVANADKISDKKNWGELSKGFSNTLIKIDKFTEGGVMDSYSIASFLRRDGELHAYGENVEISGYSYFYEKLLKWMVHQINTQENYGPLEPINQYIAACANPKEAIITIGATRYTEFGEKTFLKKGDEVIVVLYPKNETTKEQLLENINNHTDKNISILSQRVI